MNLADHIVIALRAKPMTFSALQQFMNDMADHPWGEQFFKERIAQLLLHKTVVEDADGRLSVPET